MLSRLTILLLLLPGICLSPVFSGEATDAPDKQAPFMSDADWNHSTAVQPAVPSTGSGQGTANTGKAMLQTMLALSVVLALAIGGAFFVKKFGVRRIMPSRGTYLEVVETVAVGFKRSVIVMRINDQIVLVGQGEHELNQLATFPASALTPLDPKRASQQAIDVSTPYPEGTGHRPAPENKKDLGFRATLQNLLGKRE